jgi:DNA-binding NarL/FixJ family response regulator
MKFLRKEGWTDTQISQMFSIDSSGVNRILKAEKKYKEFEKLTEIESKLIQFLVDGLTYNQIASMMNITIHGVRYHIMNIYKKLEVNTRHQIVSIFKK